MQPSSSTRATIVSAENQNGATIVKATFFFCHYYIVWDSNNAGEARGQSWNKSLKSRWIPGGSCGYTSGIKRKHFAALSSPRPCWRWLQLQQSCGSPQCFDFSMFRPRTFRPSRWRFNQGAFWLSDVLTPIRMVSLRQANVGNYMKKYSLPLIFTFYLNGDTLVLELFPVVIFQ